MMKSIAVSCISFLIISSLSAQPTLWEKTAGPPGIRVKVFYKTNNIVYAGTETLGVYKSIDNGLSWSAANTGIERNRISDIIASGPNLLAASSASNSTSACPSSANVFKSTDNGATWTPTTGINNLVPHNFAIKGSFIYTCTSINLDRSGVFRSSDNGNTWQEVASPIPKADRLLVSDNAIIVAADNLIWRSLDDGASWNVVEQFALTGIQSFARAGTKLFAATGPGLMTSKDNGGSWIFSAFAGGVASFAVNGNTIYLGSSSKVFKSIDFGATWIDVSTGLGKGAIQALWYDGTDLFAATPNDAVGIFHSTNGGTSWAPAAAGLPIASNIRAMISFGGYLFAGTEYDGIYRSPDRGDTWAKTDAGNSLLVQQLILSFCAKDNALFVGAINGIYKSTDGGATFVRTQDGFPKNTTVTGGSLTVSNGNIVAAVTVSFAPTDNFAAIFYSSDNGDTWQQANLPVEPSHVSSVASDGSPLAYAGVFSQNGSSTTGLYKSFNGGVTWVSRTSVNSSDIALLAARGNNILASTGLSASYSRDFGELEWAPGSLPGSPLHRGVFTYTLRGSSSIFAGNEGMYLSTNSGATWTPVSEGFPGCPKPAVQASASDSDHLFAGTAGEGVWRKVVDLITPSPTPSATVSPTATPTGTPTPIPTPSPTVTPSATPTPAAQAVNLSTRMRVQTGDNVGIGGFIITGTAPKQVLLRAIGPSLAQAGVPDVLANPVMELHGPGTFTTITNDNWRDDPVQEALIIATGIPPTNNLESAIVATLTPGAYTAIVRGNGNSSGVGLIEVYDLNPAGFSKLANISTRAFVSTGDNIVIAGFTLGSNTGDDRVVVRGIGPSLTALGVSNALANPTLELRNANGALVLANNDWQDNAAQAAELTAAGLAPTHPLESGITLALPPGPYTALLAGFNNGTGVGVVEVYDLGP